MGALTAIFRAVRAFEDELIVVEKANLVHRRGALVGEALQFQPRPFVCRVQCPAADRHVHIRSSAVPGQQLECAVAAEIDGKLLPIGSLRVPNADQLAFIRVERSRGLFAPLTLADGAQAEVLAAPFQFRCTPLRGGGQVPVLGEMTREPLA